MDTPRLSGDLAQPTHFCLAQYFLLPLTRKEVVAHHWWHLSLMVGTYRWAAG